MLPTKRTGQRDPDAGDAGIASPKLSVLSWMYATVAEIESDQALVSGSCALIERFEKKIIGVIRRAWGWR